MFREKDGRMTVIGEDVLSNFKVPKVTLYEIKKGLKGMSRGR